MNKKKMKEEVNKKNTELEEEKRARNKCLSNIRVKREDRERFITINSKLGTFKLVVGYQSV
jgi:hypothetical protein